VTDLLTATSRLRSFVGDGLTRRIAELEDALVKADIGTCSDVLAKNEVTTDLLASAFLMKEAAAQKPTSCGSIFALPPAVPVSDSAS